MQTKFKTFADHLNIFYKKNPKKTPSIFPFTINQCHLGNALEVLATLPKNSIDLAICDPPFAIDNGNPETQNYNRNSNKVLNGYNEIDPKSYASFSEQWINDIKPCLTPHGVLVIVSGWTNQIDILNAIKKANFTIQNEIIFRYNFGVYTQKRFVSSHYKLFVCTRHKKEYTFNKCLWYMEDVMESDQDHLEIWDIKREYWTNKIKTPNKLPKELIEMVICCYSNNGDLLLDCFSGSGTTLKVANYMHRDCIAFDIVPEFVDFANDRLKNLPY